MPLRLRGCQDRRTQAHRQTLIHSLTDVDRGKHPLRETGGGVLFEIYTAGKAGLDLSRKFQTAPPMGTWNFGLTNSKFVTKLELELSEIQF